MSVPTSTVRPAAPSQPSAAASAPGITILNPVNSEWGSEQRVATWLQSANEHGVSGVGLWNPTVPRPGMSSLELDFLVFTPTSVVVLEAKGPNRGVGGVLHFPANGHWFFEDRVEVNPFKSSGSNPFDQAKQYVGAVARFVEDQLGEERWVDGAVAVVENGAPITLTAEPQIPPAFKLQMIVARDADSVHSYLHHVGAARRKVWDARSVFTILSKLNPTIDVTVEQLVELGFPEHPEKAATTPPTPRPTQPVSLERPSAQLVPAQNRLPVPVSPQWPAVIEQDSSDKEPASGWRALPWGYLLGGAFLAAALVYGCQQGTTANEHTSTPTTQQVAPTPTDEMPARPTPTRSERKPDAHKPEKPIFTLPDTSEYEAPPACYPLQPKC